MWGTVNVTFGPAALTLQDNGGYERRTESTCRMIREAFNLYPPSFTKSVSVYTEDGDSPNHDYMYAITRPEDVPRCLPHFLFDRWREVGIESYQATFDALVEAGAKPPTDPRAFWIGANTNPLRVAACAIARSYPAQMDFRMMSWNRTDPNALHAHTPTYVSLLDHCAYRVLVDLGAGGFSARLPLLLATGRPLLLADRRFESWFYWDGTLQPWVHYIPCGATAESVVAAVQWTFAHPEEANAIGLRGQHYAKTYLTHDAAVHLCAKRLWNA